MGAVFDWRTCRRNGRSNRALQRTRFARRRPRTTPRIRSCSSGARSPRPSSTRSRSPGPSRGWSGCRPRSRSCRRWWSRRCWGASRPRRRWRRRRRGSTSSSSERRRRDPDDRSGRPARRPPCAPRNPHSGCGRAPCPAGGNVHPVRRFLGEMRQATPRSRAAHLGASSSRQWGARARIEKGRRQYGEPAERRDRPRRLAAFVVMRGPAYPVAEFELVPKETS
jgi:hypothetical protein